MYNGNATRTYTRYTTDIDTRLHTQDVIPLHTSVGTTYGFHFLNFWICSGQALQVMNDQVAVNSLRGPATYSTRDMYSGTAVYLGLHCP